MKIPLQCPLCLGEQVNPMQIKMQAAEMKGNELKFSVLTSVFNSFRMN